MSDLCAPGPNDLRPEPPEALGCEDGDHDFILVDDEDAPGFGRRVCLTCDAEEDA